jgi:two-component system response regulator BaeR
MNKKIMVVEDEQKLSSLLCDYLQRSSYDTMAVFRGDEVIEANKRYSPDLILLDLNLPGGDGIDLCKELRTKSAVPIIMVTARIDEIDRLLGLELGADDYICKPFSPREVVARVKTVLRRSSRLNYERPELKLIPKSYKAELNGRNLSLTLVEFNLLSLLANHPGTIYRREQMIEQIYSDDRDLSGRTIDTHVKNLRRKITAILPDKELIHSIYGMGYKFEWEDN